MCTRPVSSLLPPDLHVAPGSDSARAKLVRGGSARGKLPPGLYPAKGAVRGSDTTLKPLRYKGFGRSELAGSTTTCTRFTSAPPSTSLARSRISFSRNLACDPHGPEVAVTTSVPASRRAGRVSAASRSPTTSGHDRASFPTPIPLANSRRPNRPRTTSPTRLGSELRSGSVSFHPLLVGLIVV